MTCICSVITLAPRDYVAVSFNLDGMDVLRLELKGKPGPDAFLEAARDDGIAEKEPAG